MELTDDQLKQIMTGCPPERRIKYLKGLNNAMKEAEINTPKRMAAFLAQIAHESYQLKYYREIWGPTPIQKTYERPMVNGVLDPIRINKPFPKWQNLGNTEPGDGFKFRGLSWLQNTGRYNVTQAGKKLGLDLENHPELGELPENVSRISCIYWTDRNLNSYCDKDDFKGLTFAINGGLTNYDDRVRYWELAKKVLGVV